MKKIMIALDYSNAALKIAEKGFELAKVMNAEICLVHAIPDISYYSMEYSPLTGLEDFSPEDSFKTMAEQNPKPGCSSVLLQNTWGINA